MRNILHLSQPLPSFDPAARPFVALFFAQAAVYEDWSLDQSVQFLKEQGVAVKDSATLAELQAQVANYADKAATVSVLARWLVMSTILTFSGVPPPLERDRHTSRSDPKRLSTRKCCRGAISLITADPQLDRV